MRIDTGDRVTFGDPGAVAALAAYGVLAGAATLRAFVRKDVVA